MTLQGSKAEGTDMHSRVAEMLGISRESAKVGQPGGAMISLCLLFAFLWGGCLVVFFSSGCFVVGRVARLVLFINYG